MSEVLLLYFGTLFLSRTVRSKPSTGLAIDWNTTFTKADGTFAKLMDIVGNF